MSGGLRIRNLSAGYRRAVLSDLSLEAGAGRITALVGPNGSGKSTLLRAIAGLLPVTGIMKLGTELLPSMSAAERARRVALLPQTFLGDSALLVLEAAIATLKVTKSSVAEDREAAKRSALAALARLRIADLAFEPLDQLSGGQRQLAALAQIVARDAPLVLLDEPTSALDLRSQLEVMAVIRELADRGAAVVIVLHDLELAARWSDDLIVLDRGRVHAAGAPEAAVTREMLAEVYGVDARIERCLLGSLRVIPDRPLSQ